MVFFPSLENHNGGITDNMPQTLVGLKNSNSWWNRAAQTSWK